MTQELAQLGGRTVAPAALDAMDKAYAVYLRRRFSGETGWAWIAEQGDLAVASGSVSLLLWPPSPWQTSDKVGLVHSMYTEPAHRRQGLASRILDLAIQHCREHNLKWLTLGASKAAGPLYESVGFRPNRATVMNLGLQPAESARSRDLAPSMLLSRAIRARTPPSAQYYPTAWKRLLSALWQALDFLVSSLRRLSAPALTGFAFRHRGKIVISLFLLGFASLLRRGQTLGLGEPAEDYLDVVGALIAGSGHALRVAALRYVGPRSRTTHRPEARRPVLVQEGPYSVIRNPLHVGDWLIALGVCTISQVRWFMLAGPLFAGLLCYVAVLAEERDLRRQFGQEFLSYCGTTPRFFPRKLFAKLRNLPAPQGILAVVRAKEYRSFLASGTCVVLMEGVEQLRQADLLR
jgi:protein-S-isoprenylcysteine O-methyltransferase Ste14/GNAT superfamily N-acetyltransferase